MRGCLTCVAAAGVNDMTKGFDVLKISDRRTDPAEWVRMRELNVRTQPDYFD